MRYQKIESKIWNDERFRNKKCRRMCPQKYKEDRELRKKVFLRDGFACQLCGIYPENIPINYDGRLTILLPGKHQYLVIDHIVPWKKGGELSIENLQTLCGRCNSVKGNRI